MLTWRGSSVDDQDQADTDDAERLVAGTLTAAPTSRPSRQRTSLASLPPDAAAAVLAAVRGAQQHHANGTDDGSVPAAGGEAVRRASDYFLPVYHRHEVSVGSRDHAACA